MPRSERPLDQGDSPLLRFAADLRLLREKAGSPPYRRLAHRAHFSATTLSDAAGGRALPSLSVTLAYVLACDGDRDQWEQRWHSVAAELAATMTSPSTSRERDPGGKSPYVGLNAFQPEDADRFFGRDTLVAELTDQVRQRRFLAVFGPSGSGKSSVLRAGLIHTAASATPCWPTLLFTPGPHPMEECAVGLAAFAGQPASLLRAELADDPRNLHLRIRQTLVDHPPEVDLLLVVDQFEEIFTLCHDPGEREGFITALVTAAQAETSRVRVVLGIRADFYAHCAQHPDLVAALREAQVLVGPMTAQQLREAITQPAVRAGCTVAGSLLAAVVADSAGQSGVLPLVSHAMAETWRRRHGTNLTLTGYLATGGIRHAVAHTAESVHIALSPAQQDLAKALFLRLTALGEGTEDTKRRITRNELDIDDPDTATVLDALAAARLITLDATTIELTHEALIRSWPRLAHWLIEDREGLRVHRQLTDATGVWEALGHDPSALYRGTQLAIARAHATTLTRRELAFLDASLAAESDDHAVTRRRSRRLRHLVTVLAVLLILTTGTTIYAVRAQDTIAQQRNAVVARNVASEALVLHHTNSPLAVQLSLAAYRLSPTIDTRNGLLSTLTTSWTPPGNDWLICAVFSPDGHTLATASRGSSVVLWNMTDPQHPTISARLTNSSTSIPVVAFSPDGHTLVTDNGTDRTMRLWNVTNPRQPIELAPLPDHIGTVLSVAFSPDSRTLAIATTLSHAVRMWNVTDPQHPTELPSLTGHTDAVRSVAFSPDGHTLASGGIDRTARLWNVTDPQHPTELATLTGHTSTVGSVAFSPDSHTLVTATFDRMVRLWNVTNPRQPIELTTLTGNTSTVLSAAFRPVGHTLATASDDGMVRMWNVTDPQHPSELAALTGHTDSAQSVAFSPDGRTLVTAGADRTVRLVDTDFERVISHACDRAHPQITQSEWNQYFPDIAYDPPCPQ